MSCESGWGLPFVGDERERPGGGRECAQGAGALRGVGTPRFGSASQVKSAFPVRRDPGRSRSGHEHRRGTWRWARRPPFGLSCEAFAGRRCCQAADTTSKCRETLPLPGCAVDRFPRCWRGVISRTAFLTLKAAASRKRGDQARRGRSSGGSGRCLTMARVGGSNLSNHGAAGRGTSSRSGPGCATPTRPVRTTDFRASCQNRPAIGIHYLDHCAGQPKTPAGSGPVS